MQSWIVTTDLQGVSGEKHVVRRVEEVGAARAARSRGSEHLLADRIPRRRLGDGAEVLAQLAARVAIVLVAAEQHVLGVLSLLRELPQEVPDVGADAVVTQLARVDGNARQALVDDAYRRELAPLSRR